MLAWNNIVRGWMHLRTTNGSYSADMSSGHDKDIGHIA